ncbi:hypothetical protein CQW23_08609 [Capsicum baccatum]|uniref:NB-ARC domain-containing protein n=1 Tax=Capsicum baccatum TaxID=33114 RepID=A0A2G2X9J5_CAPBA|nr:hypothetical protein CQW23_08609 [Capsicum baccatum]
MGDFLIQEVNIRLSLREDIQWLQDELLFMQSFLKDAEEKKSGDQRVRQWESEINSIANDTVSILETYGFESVKGDDDGFASHLKACTCICRKETKFYKFGKEIQSLMQRIMDISSKRETYGIRDINKVGEGPKPHRSVISIYDMGGLGKTTLARNLYTNPKIVSSFPACAWIYISQEYNTLDLLLSTIKSIQGYNNETLEMLERMTERDLESHLRHLLEEQKYLVMVDDCGG